MRSSEIIYTDKSLKKHPTVNPEDVHEIIARYMLADGFPIVPDLVNSKGIHMIDLLSGETFIDFFTFFASSPLGLNDPALNNESVKAELAEAAVNKPSNSDIYSLYMAEFVQAFSEIAKPDYMRYLFFVSGGTLAVENALKVAFDWKVRKNFIKGYKEEKGHKVIHFREAFHGRSGYTLSITNTEPDKVKYFPKFNWPRIVNPKITFPLDKNIEEIIKLEKEAITQIHKAIKENPDDIAAIITEPIQAEGGDNHFRKEFFESLRQIADENDIMLIFDEVQTGFGLTGKFWAAEHFVQPDIIAFGKKAQVCGIMASERVDEVDENCFHKSSRINSTWGGNLVDMVRAKHILYTIKDENLVLNSALQGKYLLSELQKIQSGFPNLVSNARGIGLMCAFDLPDKESRNKFRDLAFKEKLIILGCGERSIRFRPPLNVTEDGLNEGLKIIKKVLSLMS
ncbi:MAG: L-lysine 6-transaminase [Ignavibacteriaceae bacterium]